MISQFLDSKVRETVASFLVEKPQQSTTQACQHQTSTTPRSCRPSQLLDGKRKLDLKHYGFCLVDQFLPEEDCTVLCCKVRDRGKEDLHEAKFGSEVKWRDSKYRGDRMAWITPVWDARKSMFVDLVSQFKSLQDELSTVYPCMSNKVSLQLAWYPGTGEGGYTRHADIASNFDPVKERRVFTAVYYLNPGWNAMKDGGEIRLYTPCNDTVDIEPVANRLVLFKSELEHEVLQVNKRPRWAITCWFYGISDRMILPPSLPVPYLPDTIFVAIPSFRDPQCQFTIKSLFETAACPERVFVGVCYQNEIVNDSRSCFEDWDRNAYPWLTQVRSVILPSQLAKGPTFARRLIHDQLWRNEEYLLNIDSHMQFRQHWDKELVSMFSAAKLQSGHDKVILTTYPSGYELNSSGEVVLENEFKLTLVGPPELYAREFGEDHVLRLSSKRLDRPISTPKLSRFWAAGYNFGPACQIKQCPYTSIDNLFFGEETLMGTRLWTHGYDFYTPNKEIVHHLWSRVYRPTFQPCDKSRKSALKKVAELLEGGGDDFGNVRTLEEYQAFAHINFQNRTLE